jgi:hypothetical protein
MKLCDVTKGLVWDCVWLSVRKSLWNSVRNTVYYSINDEDYIVARISMRGLHKSSLHMAIIDEILENDISFK